MYDFLTKQYSPRLWLVHSTVIKDLLAAHFYGLQEDEQYEGMISEAVKKADMDALNHPDPKTGDSCLHIAWRHGWLKPVIEILHKGGNADQTNHKGENLRNLFEHVCGITERQPEKLHFVTIGRFHLENRNEVCQFGDTESNILETFSGTWKTYSFLKVFAIYHTYFATEGIWKEVPELRKEEILKILKYIHQKSMDHPSISKILEIDDILNKT
jgi:hypothetical protein